MPDTALTELAAATRHAIRTGNALAAYCYAKAAARYVLGGPPCGLRLSHEAERVAAFDAEVAASVAAHEDAHALMLDEGCPNG